MDANGGCSNPIVIDSSFALSCDTISFSQTLSATNNKSLKEIYQYNCLIYFRKLAEYFTTIQFIKPKTSIMKRFILFIFSIFLTFSIAIAQDGINYQGASLTIIH